MTDADLDRFASMAEAAERLNIARSTAYKLEAEGRFPVPVLTVAGKKCVSLRRLVEFIHGEVAA